MTVTLVGTPDPQPCPVHYWETTDRHEDVYRCRYCGQTWSLDDDPDGDDGWAA